MGGELRARLEAAKDPSPAVLVPLGAMRLNPPSMRRLGGQEQSDTAVVDPATLKQVVVAAAKAGAPVEIKKEPAPVDPWTRGAQLLLLVAAIFALGMFVVFAIGDDGLRSSSVKTTFSERTGGNAGIQSTKTTTESPTEGAENSTVTVEVQRPRTFERTTEQDRPSDTITALMGGIALGLALVAATLPRLRSIEIQGVKLGLADIPVTDQQVANLTAKFVKEAGEAVSPAIFEDALLVDAWTQTAFARGADLEVPVVDPDEAAEWAHDAVLRTMRQARAVRFEAALSGADPAEATLSEAEIDAIIDETRPRSIR